MSIYKFFGLSSCYPGWVYFEALQNAKTIIVPDVNESFFGCCRSRGHRVGCFECTGGRLWFTEEFKLEAVKLMKRSAG